MVEPRSTRDIEILFKLIVKVPVVGITADTPNPGTLTINLNSISISRVLRGYTTIYPHII